MAGLEGIEPPSPVLETSVLPLNYRPITTPSAVNTKPKIPITKLFLGLFVERALAAVFAILLQRNLFFDGLFIAMRVVINFLTGTALQFDQVFLRHICGYDADKCGFYADRSSRGLGQSTAHPRFIQGGVYQPKSRGFRGTKAGRVNSGARYCFVQQFWWAGQESNLRSPRPTQNTCGGQDRIRTYEARRHQIYSLVQLTTLVPAHPRCSASADKLRRQIYHRAAGPRSRCCIGGGGSLAKAFTPP